MICLSDQSPIIELAGGSVALDPVWLQQSLQRAALAAGYPQWWPATDVAHSVAVFLQSHRSEKPFSLEKFTSSVRSALQGIGYGEVAPHFLRDGLDLSFSLLDVAEATGPGFEIGFFRSCLDACRRMLSAGVSLRIAFEDFAPAVKYMLGKTRWSPCCEAFGDELVAFLRHHLAQSCARQPLYFSMR